MLRENDIQRLLQPFGLALSSWQTEQVLTYLGLLLAWNRRINLTAVCRAEDCITRHFGESLLVSHYVNLIGRLLDIGSGAGFPGLALKIVSRDLHLTLLEPSSKKRAFLKEVARCCHWDSVEVRAERLEEFVRQNPRYPFDFVTVRAVGSLGRLIPHAIRTLREGGRLCLWLGKGQSQVALGVAQALDWQDPIPIPLSRERQIWIGVKGGKSAPEG